MYNVIFFFFFPGFIPTSDSLYVLFSAGFLLVRDAIESLRQIGDTRSLLDKKRLQKDVRDICSKMAKPTDL